VFDKKLDLYEITELARGVVDGVTGPVAIDLRAAWDNDGMTTGGHIVLDNVNFNAAALGPVTGLSGDVAFNDLALMTTPPGQTLTVKQLNPGVVVENGVINFQLLGADRIRMESASWPFAGGKLSVDPQEVQIGDDDFRMTLTLRDVDVARFLQQLDLKDLTATGTVEGSFPLIFSRGGGAIDGTGTLRAAPGGGTISYTGNAGTGLVGAPQIAFEALRSFRYDDLVLELAGKLDGELVTAIRFNGTNQEPVDVVTGPLAAPIPGLGRIRATGLPFRFTVSVRAPFRRLMQTSDGINDARPLVDEAIRNGTVDPAPQPPK
jgi:translocation and assembly module TamB